MNNTRLALGPVVFQNFEIPERVSFGGLQKLAVHELFGGRRVIDALGAQPSDVTWSGIFSGPAASMRVQMLDELRLLGATLPLRWDTFSYLVVIERLEVEYSSPWWIPYRLVCKVVQDTAATVLATSLVLANQVVSDLATATSFFALGGAQAAVAVPGAMTQGTPANIAAVSATLSGQQAIETNMDSVGSALGSADLGTSVSACGQLAGFSVARGYAGRAAATLADIDS